MPRFRIVLLVWNDKNPAGQGIAFEEDRYDQACDLYSQRVGDKGIKKVVMTLEYGSHSVVLLSWERKEFKTLQVLKNRFGNHATMKMLWKKNLIQPLQFPENGKD